MPTPGCFICHVHCLVHDGAIRSSPCRPHHENFGQNLYHMFVLAYSASQSFVLFLSCGIRVASRSNVDSIPFPKRCSHIPMWIPILHDNRYCHVNPLLNRCVSLQVDPITSTLARSIISSSQRCLFHSFQAAFVFPTRPPLFPQGLRCLNQVSFYYCEVSPFLFRQCSYPVILMKILTELQVHHSSFFSSPVDSIQALLIMSFPRFNAFSCRCYS